MRGHVQWVPCCGRGQHRCARRMRDLSICAPHAAGDGGGGVDGEVGVVVMMTTTTMAMMVMMMLMVMVMVVMMVVVVVEVATMMMTTMTPTSRTLGTTHTKIGCGGGALRSNSG